ncbi:glycosyltransferase family 4 protein [Plectonema cf. radiosum LEGE 06105]|uniref:Glycosyltransferase family 4 protein n=1 Tax=Plectonema cf. radiosum LEGE 06105 TaxID=945769 RepID=A0A8J7F3B5_9CYAN|nr:glycosyltransferase family 4 protein [Plectonema radiosum]MBE9215473.1 glycosyltransferase family 4 protein [Plectonema cf. radiosum LEGE 06105]
MEAEKVICNQNNHTSVKPASILCLGLGWFPKTPGGLERYVYELTLRLGKNKDQVELCGVGLPEQETNLPIKITNLAAPDTSILQRLWSVRNNFKKTRKTKPDAINLHFALYSLPILDLLPSDVPITFNFHGPWASESQEEGVGNIKALLKKTLVEQRTYQRCHRFIVLSQAFGNILHQQYQIPWEKIHVIPGGVDINSFKPDLSIQQARIKLGWSLERPTLFTSRRLVHRVGLDKLLAAIAQIKPKIPDIYLAIAGRGPLKTSLQQQVTELGIEDNVNFLGFLPDELLPVAYQAADLSIMPSQSFEGFGLAIVESLACGTPVICTPVGGMPEILEPFSPELITESIEVSAIAKKLEQVLNGEIAKPSPEECREYAVNNFDWDKIALQVRNVILGVS